MLSLPVSVLATAAFAIFGSANPVLEPRAYSLRTVHQFPNNSWIENMAIRKTGQIMATDLINSQIYLIDPWQQQNSPPVVAAFPVNTALTGITEVEDDVFYAQGVLDFDRATFAVQPGKAVVWQVDMHSYSTTGKATVRKIANLTQALVPNGMTVLSKQDKTFLIADSVAGLVFFLNVKTGANYIAIDDPLFKLVAGSRPAFGINGINVVGSTLYFSNTNQGLIGTIPISLSTGKATGPAKILSSNTPAIDDFAIDPQGNIWAAENGLNALVHVTPSGDVQTVVGSYNSTALLGPTAARFGRTPLDCGVLYISTDGDSYSATGQLLTSAGKIAALDVSKW